MNQVHELSNVGRRQTCGLEGKNVIHLLCRQTHSDYALCGLAQSMGPCET
jgi:hypothetical protein